MFKSAHSHWNVPDISPARSSTSTLNRPRQGVALTILAICLLGPTALAQEAVEKSTKAEAAKKAPAPKKEDLAPAAAKVEVKPVARDEEIRKRLQNVLDATGWFNDPIVRVEKGVVFISGRVETEDLKKWAGELAHNTQDVAAVANQLEVSDPAIWDFSPAWSGLLSLWRDIIRSLPFFAFGFLVLALSVGAGMVAANCARSFFRQRIRANLLRNVVARSIGALVFLIGTYIVLRVSGLTQLALTVVGGTGLIGLAVGIAFRDITENFLASIFLSIQKPFETGDLIEVAGVTGYVQQLNVRITMLMTLDGNLVQIPNATVYKTNLRNFTTNANRREDFIVTINFADSIDAVQEIARAVLLEHPAVLKDPEPSVLVDSLGESTVNLRVYFWLNGHDHSWLKVRSSVIRLVKLAFQQRGVSMPEKAQQADMIPSVLPAKPNATPTNSPASKPNNPSSAQLSHDETEGASTKAEGGLASEAGVIKEQARQVQPLKDGENLLKGPNGKPTPAKAGTSK